LEKKAFLIKFDKIKKAMTTAVEISSTPRTLEEFLVWEPNDGFKYEWNDGELIKFHYINRQLLSLISRLYQVFYKTEEFKQGGLLLAEQDVQLTGIQLRRPDIAFFSIAQIEASEGEEEQIPEFVIEVISTNDQIIKVRQKLSEYFKTGVRVVWLIYPEEKEVEVFTSYKEVKICTGTDICSASPVLNGFEISVDKLFGM
jgi:Uma2 family endonuclease